VTKVTYTDADGKQVESLVPDDEVVAFLRERLNPSQLEAALKVLQRKSAIDYNAWIQQ
jgi:hypothetical protein